MLQGESDDDVRQDRRPEKTIGCYNRPEVLICNRAAQVNQGRRQDVPEHPHRNAALCAAPRGELTNPVNDKDGKENERLHHA